MSIKLVPVEGAGKDAGKGQVSSYYDTNHRPVLTCDTKGCDGNLEGNAGMGEGELKDRAHSMGWSRNPDTSKDMCPGCGMKDGDGDYDGDKGAKKK